MTETTNPAKALVESVIEDIFVKKTVLREKFEQYRTTIQREAMNRGNMELSADFRGFSFCEDPNDPDEDIGEQRLLTICFPDYVYNYLITFGDFTEGYEGLKQYHDIEREFHAGPMEHLAGKEHA